ncbi:MAG: S9 family peptidase [Chloroflexi bacterium]|nr:S9 family peptidase [Chloroflexota bacterium]
MLFSTNRRSLTGPAILRPHGGPTDQWRFDWDPLAQYLVAKGYTFLAPNFRGSTGYGVAFEHANYDNWGVGDMQDCLHGARYLRTLDWVRPDKIGIFGSSYGGYMVACCLARDPDYLFACGVGKYGDADLYTSWAQCERETRLYTEMQMGHPSTNWQVYQAASPCWKSTPSRNPFCCCTACWMTSCRHKPQKSGRKRCAAPVKPLSTRPTLGKRTVSSSTKRN